MSTERDMWQLLLDDFKGADTSDKKYALADAWSAHIEDIERQRDALKLALTRIRRRVSNWRKDVGRQDSGGTFRDIDIIARQALKELESPRAEDYTPGPGDFGLEEK